MFNGQNKITTKKAILIAILISFAACSINPRRSGPMSSAERNLRQDAEFFSQSGIIACMVAGGVTGGTVFILAKGKDRYWKAVIAAVGACGVAVGANYYLEVQRKQHANNEDRLNATIADVHKENVRLKSLITNTRKVVADDKSKIDRIDASYKKKAISLDQARKQMAGVDDNRVFLREMLEKLKRREANWKEVAEQEHSNVGSTASLDREIASLQKQINTLNSQLAELDQHRAISLV